MRFAEVNIRIDSTPVKTLPTTNIHEYQRQATKIYLLLNPFEVPWKRDPKTGLVNGLPACDKEEQEWFKRLCVWERKASHKIQAK